MFKSYERLSVHDAGAHAGELKASGWSSHDLDSAMKKPAHGGLQKLTAKSARAGSTSRQASGC